MNILYCVSVYGKKKGVIKVNWLTIVVIITMVLAVVAGAKRGLVETVLSYVSIFVSLIVILFVRQPVSDLVKDHTELYTTIEDGVSVFVEESTKALEIKQVQITDAVIDSLKLPDVLKLALEQSNDKAIYKQKTLQSVLTYITEWLTNLILQAICCVIGFIIVWILIRILMKFLEGIMQLPVLHQIDCIAGGIGGLLIELFMLWIFGIVVTAFAATQWGHNVLTLIMQSKLLTFLYNNNVLLKALIKAIH